MALPPHLNEDVNSPSEQSEEPSEDGETFREIQMYLTKESILREEGTVYLRVGSHKFIKFTCDADRSNWLCVSHYDDFRKCSVSFVAEMFLTEKATAGLPDPKIIHVTGYGGAHNHRGPFFEDEMAESRCFRNKTIFERLAFKYIDDEEGRKEILLDGYRYLNVMPPDEHGNAKWTCVNHENRTCWVDCFTGQHRGKDFIEVKDMDGRHEHPRHHVPVKVKKPKAKDGLPSPKLPPPHPLPAASK